LRYRWHYKQKVHLYLQSPYTASQHQANNSVLTLENARTAATITQAQDKGLRHQFVGVASEVLEFCRKLYAAHGGHTAPAMSRGVNMKRPAQVVTLADRFEQYSPALSAEIRQLASRSQA
jgi:hypothetical protein